jgi:hypothetical protein
MDKYSIHATTREERIQIINKALNCGAGGCESCSGCGVFGTGDPYDMYKPYIDGIKEISQINMEFRERYTVRGSK